MSHTDKIEAQQKIVATAHSMLAGAVSFIEGARTIHRYAFVARIERDPDILPFIGIHSETDALPLGEVRKQWDTAALERLQPEIERLEKWAQECGMPHCRNLVARFA